MEDVEGPSVSLIDLLQSTAESSRVLAPDLQSRSSLDYLDQLISLPLENLLQQPTSISSETRTVENELTNLCFREYPIFISVHKCSSAVSSAFDDFSGSLGRLLDAVPDLEEECRLFAVNTTSVQGSRREVALVQEHQDKLVDLLEIPQLMDTCVRNGYYQEAMELASHAESLRQKYPSVPLIEDISMEVESVLQLMLAQLLALLREPVKLPTLVKAVSFLRRLGTIEESELSLVFLASRLHNFRIQLVHIERDRGDPVRYMRKYIDVFREHVYDIISQFTTIFQDSAEPSLLASFANQCVADLVQLVSKYIPRMSNDPASMSSVLVQLGYCALSFARVGLDFSPLITEPFTSTTLAAFAQSLSTATADLTNALRTSLKTASFPTSVLVAPEHIPALLSASSPPPAIVSTDSLPPSVIAQYPPLALVMNAHINALNSLRLLAPLALYPQFRALQNSAFVSVTAAIHQYLVEAVTIDIPKPDRPSHTRTPSSPRAHLLRRNTETQLAPEVRNARRKETLRVCVAFADVWITVILPFLTRALDTVFEEIHKDGWESTELEEKVVALREWIKDHGDKTEVTLNGDPKQSVATPDFGTAIAEEPAGMEPQTPPQSTVDIDGPASSPPTSPTPNSSSLTHSSTQMMDEGDPSAYSPGSVRLEAELPGRRESHVDHNNVTASPQIPQPLSQLELQITGDSQKWQESSISASGPIDSMFCAPSGSSANIEIQEDTAPIPINLDTDPSSLAQDMENELAAVAAGVDETFAFSLSNPHGDVPMETTDHGEKAAQAEDMDASSSVNPESLTREVHGESSLHSVSRQNEVDSLAQALFVPDAGSVGTTNEDENPSTKKLTSSETQGVGKPETPLDLPPTPSEPSSSTVPSRAPSPGLDDAVANGNGTNASGGKKKKKKKKGKP